MAPGKRGSLTTDRRYRASAGGPTAGIYKGGGSAGGPETRMKRYRGDPSGSMNGRGVPNLERALEVSGPPDLEMSSAGALKPEGSEPVLPVFSSRGSPGSQASIAPSLIFGSPEPQLRMAADRCTVGGIVGRRRQLRRSPAVAGA